MREELQRIVEEHPERIAQAIGVHEALGLSLMFGCWLACYRFQPTQSLFQARQLQGLTSKLTSSAYFQRLNLRANEAQQRSKLLKSIQSATERFPTVSPQRLTTSFVESWVFRRLATPITVPGKLYLTYKILGLWHSD